MTKKNRNQRTKKSIASLLALQSFIIVNVSVLTFELTEYFANNVVRYNPYYDPIDGIGMVLPMGVLMGYISYKFSKFIYHYIQNLINGINQVSEGNFGIQLNEKKAGPFKEVFHNFNKMSKELNSVQILREDFINSFSHEFKTPITSINGFATLLLEENIDKEDERKYLEIIASESARLSELAQRTLLLSKLESQEVVFDKTPYSLDEQIKQCAILLSPEWSKKNIDFSADLISITYHGNYELMQHIWINLLNNAIKFTPENGEITVSMIKNKNMVDIRITDSGIGMNEEVAKNIFEKYYQGDGSRTTKGLGLGLSIVKRIVELCSGEIRVSSRENEGSTFIISLPL